MQFIAQKADLRIKSVQYVLDDSEEEGYLILEKANRSNGYEIN